MLRREKYQDFLQFKSAVSILYANKGKGLKSLIEEQRKHLDSCISKMNKNTPRPFGGGCAPRRYGKYFARGLNI
jgi:hypothetical protein